MIHPWIFYLIATGILLYQIRQLMRNGDRFVGGFFFGVLVMFTWIWIITFT